MRGQLPLHAEDDGTGHCAYCGVETVWRPEFGSLLHIAGNGYQYALC